MNQLLWHFHSHSQIIRMLRATKNMSPSIYMFQDEVKQDNTQLSFSLQSVNKGPFHGLFSAMFFCIFIGDFII